MERVGERRRLHGAGMGKEVTPWSGYGKGGDSMERVGGKGGDSMERVGERR